MWMILYLGDFILLGSFLQNPSAILLRIWLQATWLVIKWLDWHRKVLHHRMPKFWFALYLYLYVSNVAIASALVQEDG